MRTPAGLFRTVIAVSRRPTILWSRSVSSELQEVQPVEIPATLSEREIQAKRDKSGLYPQHRNKLHGRLPYDEPKADFHNSLLYKRRMFGRYGHTSYIDPATLWPTENEIKDQLQYESIAYPKTIQETVSVLRARRQKENEEILERQRKIAQGLKKLDQWKREIAERSAKKLAEAQAAKAKKDALIEDVRRHFGFKIDPKDERFKEMLLQKERDNKKKLKEERSKAKQERLLASLMKSES